MKNKNINNQRGVSLIITFFIMIIVLSVVLSVSILLYSQLKVLRNIGNSVIAFYAADSGIEKVLYYDWQVKNGNIRGLCSMAINCIQDPNPNNILTEHSIYCNDLKPTSFIGGCDPAVCNNCTISFDTSFGINGPTYHLIAEVKPSELYPTSSDFNATAKGIFGGTTRQIKTPIYATE